MKKEELLKHCRYYHGEDEPPYTEDVKCTLWSIERIWVDLMLNNVNNFIDECIQDYTAAGLANMRVKDDTPLTLKAVLFNRLNKYAERPDADAFRSFYKEHYS